MTARPFQLILTGSLDWQAEAACRDVNPDVFFPGTGYPLDYARSFCEVCTVRQECLDYAIANGERDGMWGGLTRDERRKVAAARRRGTA
jgi:WhiB family redox-sensing transcriptional regulator